MCESERERERVLLFHVVCSSVLINISLKNVQRKRVAAVRGKMRKRARARERGERNSVD